MVNFAANDGRARWITSPILSEEDWKHLQKGQAAREDAILREVLAQNISDLADSLERDTLSALAWLVADGILTFKLALPHDKLDQGEFHDKFGIFEDPEENRVSFNGSYNDSYQGLRNYESLKVFRSWDITAEHVESDVTRFRRLWSGKDPNLRVFSLPDAARAQIVRLRSNKRPYAEPEERSFTYPTDYNGSSVGEPDLQLWPHQKEALDAWELNGKVGLLNMATGSGKTLTALVAARQQSALGLLVIAVPTKNLVDQWNEELHTFTDFPEPILAYESAARWQDRLFGKMRSGHRRSWPEPLVVIGSMASLSGDRFRSVLEDAGIPKNSLLIVDEVHNAGASTYQIILDPSFRMRLGLSATPERAFDEEGTSAIRDYFGGEVYSYTLREALEDERLSPYTYHTYAALLSEEEYDKYLQLTQRILAARQSEGESATLFTNNKLDGDANKIEQMLFQRARILKKAAAKLDLVSDILENHPFDRGLIYCADREQLEEVQNILRDLDLVHLKYTGETSKDKRRVALEALETGQVPAILAIKCLDEGVDVPAADTAIILASSTNERQFIQRRGRVLRRAGDKKQATLVDVITLPPASAGRDAKWMLRGELRRAKKMAELARNREEALLEIKAHTKRYGVMLTQLLSDEDTKKDDAELPV